MHRFIQRYKGMVLEYLHFFVPSLYNFISVRLRIFCLLQNTFSSKIPSVATYSETLKRLFYLENASRKSKYFIVFSAEKNTKFVHIFIWCFFVYKNGFNF
jgi:hypothetical protein